METSNNPVCALLEFLPDPAFIILDSHKEEVKVNQKLLKLLQFSTEMDLFHELRNTENVLKKKELIRLLSEIDKTKNRQVVKGKKYNLITKKAALVSTSIQLSPLGSVNDGFVLGCLKSPKVLSINSGLHIDKVVQKLFNDEGILDEVIAILDFNGDVISANRKLFLIDFYADFSNQNVNLFKIVDKSEHKKLKARLEQLRNGIQMPPAEYKLAKRHNKYGYIEVFSKPALVNRQKFFISVIRDITGRKELEKRMIDTIIQTEDRERKRFARDLHDEIGPYLAGLKLYLNELEDLDNEPVKRQQVIKYMIEVGNEAIQRIRETANNMLPTQIEQFGLVGSIRNFFDKLNQSKRIGFSLHSTGHQPVMEQSLSFSIYRIVIELITNTLKHASANKIEITFGFHTDSLHLRYKDDGKGFEIDGEIKANKGIGLQSIINRTLMYNGSYQFKSKLNKGIDFEFHFSFT
jgi:PAS domain S-box-containing protein